MEKKPEGVEGCLNTPALTSLSAVVALAVELGLITPTCAYDALRYGALMGAELASCVEAIELYLPQLEGTPLQRDCWHAFLNKDLESFDIFWQELFPNQDPPQMPAICLRGDSE